MNSLSFANYSFMDYNIYLCSNFSKMRVNNKNCFLSHIVDFSLTLFTNDDNL